MILFKNKYSSNTIQKAILDELVDVKSILKESQNENKSLNWVILSLEDDIRKLKEKNIDLKNKLKKYEKKEGIDNDN